MLASRTEACAMSEVFMFLDSPTQTLEVSFRVKHGDGCHMVYVSWTLCTSTQTVAESAAGVEFAAGGGVETDSGRSAARQQFRNLKLASVVQPTLVPVPWLGLAQSCSCPSVGGPAFAAGLQRVPAFASISPGPDFGPPADPRHPPGFVWTSDSRPLGGTVRILPSCVCGSSCVFYSQCLSVPSLTCLFPSSLHLFLPFISFVSI